MALCIAIFVSKFIGWIVKKSIHDENHKSTIFFLITNLITRSQQR